MGFYYLAGGCILYRMGGRVHMPILLPYLVLAFFQLIHNLLQSNGVFQVTWIIYMLLIVCLYQLSLVLVPVVGTAEITGMFRCRRILNLESPSNLNIYFMYHYYLRYKFVSQYVLLIYQQCKVIALFEASYHSGRILKRSGSDSISSLYTWYRLRMVFLDCLKEAIYTARANL